MHHLPELRQPVFGYEVAGEQEESGQQRCHQRRPGDEIRRHGAEEEHERVGHQNYHPDHEDEEPERLPRGAKPYEEVDRHGVEDGDGEEVGQENQRVGDDVRG
ncbi:unnamed protein product [Cuscuta europaea]|uniref:Uncharacterized protein n=1 Tax=Cuscuta europaea TaxID=41803 RepID=A0A9P0YP54_CUSEU|nr:unnamed protein product [Cuscuta europaea]